MTGWASSEPVKRDEPHWYRIDIYECPVCGRGEEHRTRMAGEPPEDPAERYSFEHTYDWCMG